jgi:glycosyltransferase involved in cell wall biosynthesis
MHVLTLTAYPALHVGGVSMHARDLGLALADAGHDVDVATVDGAGAPGVTRDQDGKVRLFAAGPVPFGVSDGIATFEQQNLRALAGALAAARDRPVDLVTAHGHFFGPAGALAADALGVPFVFHAHNMYSADVGQPAAEREYYAAVEGHVLARARMVIAISDFIADLCLELGTARERVRVIPKGLHLDRFAGDWAPPTQPTLLFVGRISPEKGLDVALDALQMLHERGTPARLVIAGVGDAEYVATVRGRIDALGLRSAVAFLGNVAPEGLPKLFQTTSLTIVPSHFEALGRVALEAMAAGAPVVVTDTGGLGPLVEPGVTGWRVPAGDPVALADAIAECLADPTTASERAARARTMVAGAYSWETVFAETLDVYRTATADGMA